MTVARIEIGRAPGEQDPSGVTIAQRARRYLDLPVKTVATRAVYKLSMALGDDALERVRVAMTDPILERSAIGRLPLEPTVDWVVAVGFKPGVTDNVGQSARLFVADVVGPEALAAADAVYTETLYLVTAPELGRREVERLGRELLANEVIERVSVWSAADYAQSPVDRYLPLAGDDSPPRAVVVVLPQSDEQLLQLSRERTLSLSLAELRAIQFSYQDEDRAARRRTLGLPPDQPTDLELEVLAQTWSEHCKHKIFNATIHYRDLPQGTSDTIHSLFRTYISSVTRELRPGLDWLLSVFDDNAGVVAFDDELALAYKVETHNSPSALDPYGGAITGIVGVNRDPLGTGLGAALLTNVWGYCLADPATAAEDVPEGLLAPRRIRDGVHQGVIDGGNQSGIPYSRGFELFDQRYLGKPLVFCGTVATMPRTLPDGRLSHQKEVRSGDLVVMVGGRIGKDGIHGATFSSEALHSTSPAQAVQIGDPITQKKMSDMLLEARDLGLYRAITDNGAGGLSSSVGEMAQLCGGAEIDLALAPLKYAGLQPWEILLSEAQERMTLAVPPGCIEQLDDLARRREVELTVLGQFTSSGCLRVLYGGQVVGELELELMHHGCPTMELQARWDPPPATAAAPDLEHNDAGRLLGDLLASPEICSKEARWRQYDHEVKGLSVLKPLVGRHGDIPSDCTAMRVSHGRPGAVLLSEGIAPQLSDLDTRLMARYVVDLAVRRLVAGGARLGHIAGLDNFCWPDPVQSAATPDGEHKLAQLVRACQGLAEMCRELGLPCISGKDSMKNDSVRGGTKISIPPTLLFSALAWVDDVERLRELTPTGDAAQLVLVGQTRPQLGASAALRGLGSSAGAAPDITAAECRRVCTAVEQAMDRGLVQAAHAPHLGGLAVALARLALAADQGLELELDAVPTEPGSGPAAALFAESGSRLLLCVDPAHIDELGRVLGRDSKLVWARIGQMNHSDSVAVRRAGALWFETPVAQLRRRFKETLDER